MTGSVRGRVEHRFYAWSAIAAFAIVFGGFARTYYLKAWFSAPPLPWLLHLHGALMTSWFALFFAQTYLIASHRIALHRRLGLSGAVLASLIIVVGAVVAVRAGARDLHAPAVVGPPPLEVMGFFFFVLLVFAILVGAALLLRRRTNYHKRLILLSAFTMIGPGLSRISFAQVPVLTFLRSGGPAGLFSLDLLLLYACIAWDSWRHRRLHPAFVCGAPLIMAESSPLIWSVLASPTWTRFATWLVT